MEAIHRAQTMEEVNRLEQALQSGKIPKELEIQLSKSQHSQNHTNNNNNSNSSSREKSDIDAMDTSEKKP